MEGTFQGRRRRRGEEQGKKEGKGDEKLLNKIKKIETRKNVNIKRGFGRVGEKEGKERMTKNKEKKNVKQG